MLCVCVCACIETGQYQTVGQAADKGLKTTADKTQKKKKLKQKIFDT